jgi:hypothetical protein
MKIGINFFKAEKIRDLLNTSELKTNGSWGIVRPVGFIGFTYKLKAIILILKGEADLIVWPN